MIKRLRVIIFFLIGFLSLAGISIAEQKGKIDETFLLLMAARNASKAGEYGIAIKRYHKLLEKDSAQIDARKELASVFLKAGKFEEAETEYEDLLKIKPDDIESLKGLLEVLKKSGKKEESLKTLEKLVSLVPKNRDIRLQLAIELHNRERFSEADKHFAILLNEKD